MIVLAMRIAPAAALAVLAASCTSDPSVVVELRSDFLPGVEVSRALTFVSTDGRVVGMGDAALAGSDLLGGARIAEVGALPRGDYTVTVDLEGPDGRTVFTRRVLLELRDPAVVTVLASRACAGIGCPGPDDPPGATECLAGRCVDPRCQQAASCGAAECATSDECPAPAATCAQARCTDGACLAVPRAGACASGEVCIAETGCVALSEPPDAGVDDAGADAGSDAGSPACPGGCSDGNPCTADVCDAGRCEHPPVDGACDDRNDCTRDDHCSGGGCSGSAFSCSPPDSCTTVWCDGSGCGSSGGCGAGSTCTESGCAACGGADQICCGGSGCNPGLWCYTGVCTCGQGGGPCCPWDGSCAPGFACAGGTCA